MILSNETKLKLFRMMVRIRMFEEKVAEMIETHEIKTPCHLYIGQEAVATGICSNLCKEDIIYSNHRSHGHFISKGGSLNELMAEILCKETGCSKGRGGSMHLFSKEMGFPGSTAIVGGSIPLAIGAALSYKITNKNNVAIAFFGDGAVSEGILFEAVNFSVLNQLPIIFVCENNLYATHMPIKKVLSNHNITDLVAGFNVLNYTVDGNDVFDVYSHTQKSIEHIKSVSGPVFLECLTYRWRGHVGPNYDVDKGLRDKKELEYWMKKDPINKITEHLLHENIATEIQLAEIKDNIATEIHEAVQFGRNSPYPSLEDDINSVFR